MHYFEREMIMSFENALKLKPKEIAVLEHVRTYEYADDELLPAFVEIKYLEQGQGVVVKKNKILDFPEFELVEEDHFSTIEEAMGTFHKWIEELVLNIDETCGLEQDF